MLRTIGLAATIALGTTVPVVAMQGSGDSVTARAVGLGQPVAVIADPFGDFIVSDRDGNRVWWATSDGRKQVITTAIPNPTALGWDIFANLIIIGPHAVYKFSPQGNVTQMFAAEELSDVALAPDGTLWFADPRARSLRHHDARGNLISAVSVSLPNHTGPHQLAVNAAGEVYYTGHNGTGGMTVYKLTASQGQVIFSAPWQATDFALATSGNFYLPSGADNHVYRYSAFGAPLNAPLATSTMPTGIAFARNADGSMNSQLFAVELSGRLVQVNSSAIQEAGVPVGFATAETVIGDLLKGSGLTTAQRLVLDRAGNNNGRYDVGDLRAFLTSNGTLATTYAY